MFTMVRSGSIPTITFILLITSNFLHSLGEVESLTDKVESKETKDPETDESAVKSAVTILPGEGFANENRKTVEKESSLKVSLEEKSVDIKQGDLGKTKEVNDGDKKEMDGKKVDGENEVNADEKKEGQDEVKDKEGEKLKEQTGIDLKVLTDNDFEHLTQASTGATTGDWLVLL